MRTRAFRRHQASRHMWRRLKEDRNQHYDDLTCACWSDPKTMARFKEQPKRCSCWGCANRRRYDGDSIQERRAQLPDDRDDADDRWPSADLKPSLNPALTQR